MEFRFPEDEGFPAWKIIFFQCLIAVAFFGLLAGYWRLQIGQHYLYQKRADRNRIRYLPIIAPRGKILDRNGRVLASSLPAFSVLLERENPSVLTPARLKKIAAVLHLDPQEAARVVHNAKSLPAFEPVVLKASASMDDVSFVESHQTEFPELELMQVERRIYPLHTAASAVLGYVGEVSQETIARSHGRYRPGDLVGKSGIEREYNSILEGRDGTRRVVVNSRGEVVGTLKKIPAVPGHNLRLTLNLDLQVAAEMALGNHAGAIVALDPRNGQVLAMVSHPSFDPNDFAARMDARTWKELTTDPQHPLMNKAIQAQLAPGSVFKIFVAAAALETGTITPSFTIFCPGYVNFYGHTYHDWIWWERRTGHGEVNLHRAIVVSCDSYFYTLGKMLGIDKIAYYAKKLGLGSRTGIDLPGEEPGLIPTPAWVESVFKHPWYAGETISVAIGQGAVAVTPLQLAYALGGITSGGVFYRPHVAFSKDLPARYEASHQSVYRFPLKPQTVAALTSGMYGVVNEGGGTGAGARCPGLDIAGKTGTAQVVSAKLQSSDPSQYRNNAWFVGFWPPDHPKIVVAALVMHGSHSSIATPMVRSVIQAYHQEEAGSQPLVAHNPPPPPPRAGATAVAANASEGNR